MSISNHEILSNTSSGHVTSKINLSGWFPSWASTGDKAIALRRMILEVVTIARKHKFETVTNVNIKGDIDGLMFQHKPQVISVYIKHSHGLFLGLENIM